MLLYECGDCCRLPWDTFFWLLVGVCLTTVLPRAVFIRYPQPEHVLLITTTLQTDFTASPGILQLLEAKQLF